MAIEAAGDASYSFLETYDEAKSIATNTSKIVSELTVVLSDIKGWVLAKLRQVLLYNN